MDDNRRHRYHAETASPGMSSSSSSSSQGVMGDAGFASAHRRIRAMRTLAHGSPLPSAEAAPTRQKFDFIYKLPYCAYLQLCRNLDADKKWDMLAGLMKMDPVDIKLFGLATAGGGSPTDEVLKKFGERNGRISHVFCCLYKMQYFKGMEILREYVDEKYWHLMGDQQGGFSQTSQIPTGCIEPPSAPPYKAESELPIQPINGGRAGGVAGAGAAAAGGAAGFTSIKHSAAPRAGGGKADEEQRLQAKLVLSGVKVLSIRPTSSLKHEPARTINLHNVDPNANINFEDIELEPIKHIPHAELTLATRQFASCNIIGRGGFGIVYRGQWKDIEIAVKKIRISRQPGSREHVRQVLTELRVLEKCRFPNILALYGVSVDNPNEPCLIYEFMPGGSLDDRLKRKQFFASMPPLTWWQRMCIARGTARGLNYLHTVQDERPLVHGDVKPANILLDANLQPKLGDFGLTREGPQGERTHRDVSRVHGTRPYLPLEYLQGKQLSTKVDVYSFGLVLLELATNLKVLDESRRPKMLSTHMAALKAAGRHLAVRDPEGGDEPDTLSFVELFIDLGLKCAAELKMDRPEMAEVLEALKEGAAACKSPQPMATGYSREPTATVHQLGGAAGWTPGGGNMNLGVPVGSPRLSPSDNMQVAPSSPVPPQGTTLPTGTTNLCLTHHHHYQQQQQQQQQLRQQQALQTNQLTQQPLQQTTNPQPYFQKMQQQQQLFHKFLQQQPRQLHQIQEQQQQQQQNPNQQHPTQQQKPVCQCALHKMQQQQGTTNVRAVEHTPNVHESHPPDAGQGKPGHGMAPSEFTLDKQSSERASLPRLSVLGLDSTTSTTSSNANNSASASNISDDTSPN